MWGIVRGRNENLDYEVREGGAGKDVGKSSWNGEKGSRKGKRKYHAAGQEDAAGNFIKNDR